MKFITFTQQQANIWLSPLENSDKKILYSYHCKIESELYPNSMLLKTITLEENVKETKNQLTPISRNDFINHNKALLSESKSKDIDETQPSADFPLEKDEKEHGWIDFQVLNTRKNSTPLIKSEETCTEPKTTSRPIETERKLLNTDIMTTRRTNQDQLLTKKRNRS